MTLSIVDIRIMVFVAGAFTLNAVGFLVYFMMFLCKTNWMERTLQPFYCLAFTYFGIYGAVVLWANELFQVYLGNKEFNSMNGYEETTMQQKVRMNITLESANAW